MERKSIEDGLSSIDFMCRSGERGKHMHALTRKLKHVIKVMKRKLQDPIQYSRSVGVEIGERCKLNGVPNWGSEPWLISLGDHVEISFDCVFITHDGATWVFRDQDRYKNVIKFGKIRIGDNCFIGARSTIMPGVTIGENSVIAAGALVTKDIPAGEVWGGVPARFITTTEAYAEKCLSEIPEYDVENFRKNKKEEVLRILK